MSVSVVESFEVKRNKRHANIPKCCHEVLGIWWFLFFIKSLISFIFLVWWSTLPHRLFALSSIPMSINVNLFWISDRLYSFQMHPFLPWYWGFSSFYFWEVIFTTYNFMSFIEYVVIFTTLTSGIYIIYSEFLIISIYTC